MLKRLALVSAVAALFGTAVPVAHANHDGSDPVLPTYPMPFPVIGGASYSDTFHASRGNHLHQGNDLMADKMIPVVAVADGTVGWMHDQQGGNCCAMALYHDDGWESWYIHLNNDTPGTDDGQGWGFAPGITSGVAVEAGEHIGWVGDSGNAEGASPHLHFELHHPTYGAVNPYPHLQAAPILTAPGVVDSEPPCPPLQPCDSIAAVDGAARYHLRESLAGASDEASFYYGNPGDVALFGDWDCDGVATPAMYRPSDGFMYLRNSNTQGAADIIYFYGDPSDTPLVGDWNGDGCDTLAIYRATEGKVYIKNTLGEGFADFSYFFGNPGDEPFAGDFDGDGVDSVGLYRVSTGFAYFRNDHQEGPAQFAFYYGDPSDQILAGDWDGDGDDTVAVYRPSTGTFYVNLENAAGVADYTLPIGSYESVLTATGDTYWPSDWSNIERCLLDTFNASKPGWDMRIHATASGQARAVAVQFAETGDWDQPVLDAAGEEAKTALEGELEIPFDVATAVWGDGDANCGDLSPVDPEWSALIDSPNAHVGLAVVLAEDGSGLVVAVVVKALPKETYEAALGITLSDSDYELLVFAGPGALDPGT